MGKFVVKKVDTGVKFDLKADNHEIIATSEVYSSEAACLNGVESVRKNAPIAGVEDQTTAGYQELKHPKFEIYLDHASEHRFRLKAKNGEVIAVSEGYSSKSGCEHGIASVKKNAPDAQIVKEG